MATLTTVISKLFESVILQLTENKLQTNNLQFSFKKALAVQILFLPLEMLSTILRVMAVLYMLHHYIVVRPLTKCHIIGYSSI